MRTITDSVWCQKRKQQLTDSWHRTKGLVREDTGRVVAVGGWEKFLLERIVTAPKQCNHSTEFVAVNALDYTHPGDYEAALALFLEVSECRQDKMSHSADKSDEVPGL